MTQPRRTSSVSPSIDWLMLVLLLVSVLVAGVYVALLSNGDHVLPGPLNGLVFVAISTCIILVAVRRIANEIMAILDRLDRGQIGIRAVVLAQMSTQSGEVTGEVPRTPQQSPGPRDGEMDVYAQGYVDGLARKPIPARVIPFSGRHPVGS